MDTYARYQFMASRYPHTLVGRSVFGRSIYAFFVGNPTVRPVIFQGAIHAREWVSAEVCASLFHTARELPLTGGYWFLPLINPDGVLLATRGITTAPLQKRQELIALNGGTDFSLWKANGRGVDLNVNFDAKHGKGRSNVFAPAPENFVGEYPESEPCTRALVDFTRKVSPCATVSLHTKGQEIYWNFPLGKGKFSGDKTLAKRLFSPLRYAMKATPGSTGGYKDWCIQALQIPAFTVELFSDALTHPVQKSATVGLAPLLRDIIRNTEKYLWKNVKNSCAPR